MLFKTTMLALVAATIMGAAAPPGCYLIQWPSGRLEWYCPKAAVTPLVLEAAPAPKPPPTPCILLCDPAGKCEQWC